MIDEIQPNNTTAKSLLSAISHNFLGQIHSGTAESALLFHIRRVCWGNISANLSTAISRRR
jgi:hypothetical protein